MSETRGFVVSGMAILDYMHMKLLVQHVILAVSAGGTGAS